jgi:CDP-diacylglycerol---serine O-phosphatidyltransferase
MLTLGNLLCGCLAIIEVLQNKSINTACIYIVIALIFDFFDGFLARLLKVNSPIGRELDSLADMVTFGILPAFIMQYLMVTYTNMSQNMSIIAFAIALFSGLRLAKFNIDTRQSDSFIGVPTPANAILIASIALNIDMGNSAIFAELFSNQYAVIGLTFILCYLLVAEIPLFAFKFKDFKWKGNEVRFLFILGSILLISLFQFIAIPWLIVAYVILSVIMNFRK